MITRVGWNSVLLIVAAIFVTGYLFGRWYRVTKKRTRYFVINGRPSAEENLDAAEKHGTIVLAKYFTCPRGVDVYGVVEIKKPRKRPR